MSTATSYYVQERTGLRWKAGDVESAVQRRGRLKKRVQAEKTKGNKAFLKTVSEEEGISVSRLKQLLKEAPEPTKAPFRRSTY